MPGVDTPLPPSKIARVLGRRIDNIGRSLGLASFVGEPSATPVEVCSFSDERVELDHEANGDPTLSSIIARIEES